MKWTVQYFDNDADEGLDAILSLDERGEAMVAISGRNALHLPAARFYLKDGGYNDGWMELGCMPGKGPRLLVVGAETCDSLADHLPQLGLRPARGLRAVGLALLLGSALVMLMIGVSLIGTSH